MSIDTAAKRKAISGVLVPFLLVGVTPDATHDEGWRQAAGWSYSGIAVAEVSVEEAGGFAPRLHDPTAIRLGDPVAVRLGDPIARRIPR